MDDYDFSPLERRIETVEAKKAEQLSTLLNRISKATQEGRHLIVLDRDDLAIIAPNWKRGARYRTVSIDFAQRFVAERVAKNLS